MKNSWLRRVVTLPCGGSRSAPRKLLVKPRYFRIAPLNSVRSLFNVQAAAKD
jgi:hypothetical protein